MKYRIIETNFGDRSTSFTVQKKKNFIEYLFPDDMSGGLSTLIHLILFPVYFLVKWQDKPSFSTLEDAKKWISAVEKLELEKKYREQKRKSEYKIINEKIHRV